MSFLSVPAPVLPMSAPAAAASMAPPPVLRPDLSVHVVDPDPDGSPAWVMHDPVANRYFRIGMETVDMLTFVQGLGAEEVAGRVRARYGHE